MFYRYIGRDGDFNLKKDNIYEVHLIEVGDKIIANIIDENINVDCPYDTLSAFYKNWQETKVKRTKICIDSGNTRGLTRQLDKLGRIVIPSEFRKELNIKTKDKVEIFLLKDGIFVKSKKM